MDHDADAGAAVASLVLACGLLLKKRQHRRRRRWWMTSFLKSRTRYSGTNLLTDLAREPSVYFENFCRMNAIDFEYLLSKIGPRIAKRDTNMRRCIPVQERFAVALRFLATGDSFISLSYLFKISKESVSICVEEVCLALIKELKEEIKIPKCCGDWKLVAEGYKKKWDFPHCLGSLDGKHVVIQKPANSSSDFINYKGSFSIVLMALVDADYNVLMVDIGCQGRISGGGVFCNTTFFKNIVKGDANFPALEPLPGKNKPLPHVIIGDDAFSVSEYLLKPYPGMYNKGSRERIFNYRLCRAHRVVENVFGIMASIYRVFRKPMLLSPDRVARVTMTCCLLHNFMKKRKNTSPNYIAPGMLDSVNPEAFIPGSWRADWDGMESMLPLKKVGRRAPQDFDQIRDSFAEYFVTNGQVPWQENM